MNICITAQLFSSAVLITDPAVAYLPGEGYGPYDRGTELDIWLKSANGSQSLGLVWPGAISISLNDALPHAAI